MTPIASRFAACLLGLVLMTSLPVCALAEKRVALVIGNANYQFRGTLKTPANDAEAMASLLKAAGFDHVELKLDLGAREFKRALRAFDNTAAGADIIVIYYAGHGIEVEQKNRMVPVDASLKHEVDVEDETVALNRLTDIADGAKKLGLIILDACRNNPLAKNMERKRGSTRTIAPGLAQVEPNGNTLVAFAAKAGTEAEEGTDKHSPYTKALLKHLTEPAVDIQLALRRVRDEVRQQSKSRQDPYFYGTLGGTEIPLVRLASTTDPKIDVARHDYEFALQVNTRAVWEVFLRQHPTGLYAEFARGHLSKLSAPAQPKTPSADELAEAERLWQTLRNSVGSGVIEELRNFIRRFPNSPLAIQAQRRLEQIERAVAERDGARRRQQEEAAAAARKRQ